MTKFLDYKLTPLLLLSLIFAACAAYRFNVPLNHDVAWILTGAERLFDGGVFGRDVVDVNPPLPWLINQPAIWLHKAGLSLASAFNVLVLTLTAISLYLSCRVMRIEGYRADLLHWLIVVMAYVGLLGAGYHFGQREHIMVILIVPYILLCAARAGRRSLPTELIVSAAIFAAFGLFQKPFFITIPLCMELWLQSRRIGMLKLFRLEMIILLICGLTYVAGVWVFARPYLTHVLPGVLSNYAAYNVPIFEVSIKGLVRMSGPVILTLITVLLARTRNVVIHDFVKAFVIAAIGAYLAALWQSKGWMYHILSGNMLLLIASGILIVDITARRERSWHPVILGIIFMIVSISPTQVHLDQIHRSEKDIRTVAAMTQTIKASREPRRVYAFVTSPRNVHPAVIAGRGVWVDEAAVLHFLPSSVRYPTAEHDRVAGAQLDAVMDRLLADPPQIIFIDNAGRKLGFNNQDFDYVKYLSEHYPDQALALFMRYEEGNAIEDYRYFVLK
ncbi:hypothetical protein [Robiginitomaculum antarcticum]|uniref:hypothetical protein n=1 Tax=Robiginitomaculum antarcticum TaxID=437507 RepID=UPI00037BCADB|nr:hypothetical protein [Robiginitomaculum antarcticum]